MSRRLVTLPDTYRIVQLNADQVDNVQLGTLMQDLGFVSVTRTVDEISIILADTSFQHQQANLAAVNTSEPFRILQLHGVYDLSEIGILAPILNLLRDAMASIFVISTWNTDYVMVKQSQYAAAVQALKSAQYEVDTLTDTSNT